MLYIKYLVGAIVTSTGMTGTLSRSMALSGSIQTKTTITGTIGRLIALMGSIVTQTRLLGDLSVTGFYYTIKAKIDSLIHPNRRIDSEIKPNWSSRFRN
jgi:hypothetical protein